MKTKTILLSLLLLSNSIWAYLFFSEEDSLLKNSKLQIYNLEGESKNWSVKNYKIVITSEEILRGHAKLKYKGDAADIKRSNYFDATFYEENHKNEDVVVYSKTVSSTGDSISILTNLEDIGSITGPYNYDETLRTKANYENSYVEISWTDNDGLKHTDRVELNITDEMVGLHNDKGNN